MTHWKKQNVVQTVSVALADERKMSMEIIEKKLEELKEYENNPRDNDGAVDAVAESIKQFGFKVPIIIDKNGIIVAGHTRRKAAKKLGLKVVPCIVADDLTEEQVKAFRLADNKVSEFATWDFAKLEQELIDLSEMDMSAFGFEIDIEGFDESDLDDDTKKENVIVSVNCNNVNDYEEIKERLQNLADEVNATVSVKMA